ncbi:MAG: hypothetical protein B6U95_00005 [Thermofilum sp. ex4484_82]|nr:MAG: hypothetical protein B6U95_00005 [Thermofilum sp. ex4484_82]OYT40112.1 MAG: hypothetical protein B6U96_00005 [Archaeoglobales archaeon ex4484_92]
MDKGVIFRRKKAGDGFPKSIPEGTVVPLRPSGTIGIFQEIISQIQGSKFDDGYIIHQIVQDVKKLGEKTALHYVLNFSPSKLGKLGFLGLRKLAIIRRDHPSEFEKILGEKRQIKTRSNSQKNQGGIRITNIEDMYAFVQKYEPTETLTAQRIYSVKCNICGEAKDFRAASTIADFGNNHLRKHGKLDISILVTEKQNVLNL